jgi:hypothetical protein
MHISDAELYSSHVFLFPGFKKPTERCHVCYRGKGGGGCVDVYGFVVQ